MTGTPWKPPKRILVPMGARGDKLIARYRATHPEAGDPHLVQFVIGSAAVDAADPGNAPVPIEDLLDAAENEAVSEST